MDREAGEHARNMHVKRTSADHVQRSAAEKDLLTSGDDMLVDGTDRRHYIVH